MSFKSIGDLAISVLAKLEIEAGCEAADERASPRPSQIDTANRVARPAGVRGGLIAERAFAQGGEVAAEQTELGKGTASEPAAKFTGEEPQTKAISRNWMAISASLRTIRRNKCAAAPQGSPTLAAHLFLVIGHASHPH